MSGPAWPKKCSVPFGLRFLCASLSLKDIEWIVLAKGRAQQDMLVGGMQGLADSKCCAADHSRRTACIIAIPPMIRVH
jgi:hypothetical protein